MLTVVAALIIVLGLMVSLAWDVRRQSSERLTKELLGKLDRLMAQYIERHHQVPQVAAFIEPVAPPETEPQAPGDGRDARRRRAAPAEANAALTTRKAEDDLPDEATLFGSAEANNRDFVLALRGEAGSPSPELFGPLAGSMYDEVTLRDAWGTPIVFMPSMHPAIGMALGNRPFFFSAGPDRTFRTLEDNLYSYEQTTGVKPEGE
jgi:hypothetical protein